MIQCSLVLQNDVGGVAIMASVVGPTELSSPYVGVLASDGLFEVVGGQILEKPPMGVYESGLATLLVELLGPFARGNRLGQIFCETLFDLRPSVDGSRRPDLAFVSAQKWPVNRRPPQAESWPIIPDLAVEIVSSTNYATNLLIKIREYLQAGVQLVWVIYPSVGEIHIFDARTPQIIGRLQGGDILRGEPVLPGFELPLEVLFGEEEEGGQA
jgi:Uma2 family endonuclease